MLMRFLFQGTGYSESANLMFRHHSLRRRVPIFDVPAEMLELNKHRKAWICNKLQKKQLTSGSYLPPLLEFLLLFCKKMCTDNTSYALEKFLEVSFLHSSRFRVDKTHLTTGRELLASILSILEISNLPMTLTAVFTVTHSCVNVRRAHSSFELISCLIDVFVDDKVSRKVFKKGCTCCKPVSNGFPCAHMMKTLYAEELQ